MIYKDGRTLQTKVIQTTNKHTYIKPKNGYIEIHLSKYARLDDIIKRILPNFDKYEALTKPIDAQKLMLWGYPYLIQINAVPGFSYVVEKDVIVVNSTYELSVIKDTILKHELQRKLDRVKEDIHQTIKTHGYHEVPMKLKKLKSKFGSYHLLKHEITLNTKLAHYDSIYLTYVLYHEYTHQKYPHHQPTFYRALQQLFPDYKSVQKALKRQPIYE